MPSKQVQRARFPGSWPVPAVGHWDLTRQRTVSALLPHPDPALLLDLMGLLMGVRRFVSWFWLSQHPRTRYLHSIFLLCLPVLPRCPGNDTDQARYPLPCLMLFCLHVLLMFSHLQKTPHPKLPLWKSKTVFKARWLKPWTSLALPNGS